MAKKIESHDDDVKPELDWNKFDQLQYRCGLNQEKLAERAGLSSETIRRLRNGGRITTTTVGKLATALGIDPLDLYTEQYRRYLRAQTKSNDHVHTEPEPPPSPPSHTPKPNNLPLVGLYCAGRDEFLIAMREAITQTTARVAVTNLHAIHGLGGVGKTRVAVEYANRYADHYSALLFITADSPTTMNGQLAQLCAAHVLNLKEQGDTEQAKQVAAVGHWLDANENWLFIADNVDTSEAAQAVERFLHRYTKGHVVITSRLSNWKNSARELPLDILSEEAAQTFLRERTAGKRATTPTDETDAAALANDLGYLPLALEQAGAYIVATGCSFATYRTEWQKHNDDVLKWCDQREMKYSHSVATTWVMSFDQLNDHGRGLLNILCWLAPEPIPVPLLEKLTHEENETPISVRLGIADLLKYSFLKWTDADHATVEIHRLVQEITAHRLPDTDKKPWLQRCLRMMDAFCVGDPYDVQTWKDIYTPAQPHLRMLIPTADQAGIAEPTARLMSDFAVYLQTQSEYKEAEPLMRRALAIDEASFGPHHPNVAIRLNNLAQLLKATNRLAEAEPLMQRGLVLLVLFHMRTNYQHPHFVTVRGNYERLLQQMGRGADEIQQALAAIDAEARAIAAGT